MRTRMNEALAAPPLEMIAGFAALNADLLERTARLLALGEHAAPRDPQLAALRERGHQAMRSDCQAVADALDTRGALAIPVQDAAATIYAVAGESTYLRLVDGSGWTPERYRAWLERTLKKTLLSQRVRLVPDGTLQGDSTGCGPKPRLR